MKASAGQPAGRCLDTDVHSVLVHSCWKTLPLPKVPPVLRRHCCARSITTTSLFSLFCSVTRFTRTCFLSARRRLCLPDARRRACGIGAVTHGRGRRQGRGWQVTWGGCHSWPVPHAGAAQPPGLGGGLWAGHRAQVLRLLPGASGHIAGRAPGAGAHRGVPGREASPGDVHTGRHEPRPGTQEGSGGCGSGPEVRGTGQKRVLDEAGCSEQAEPQAAQHRARREVVPALGGRDAMENGGRHPVAACT